MKHPFVNIDGTTYYFREDLAAQIRCLKMGVDPCAALPPNATQAEKGKRLVAVTAAYAHVEMNGVLQPAGLSVEDTENLLTNKNWDAVADALAEAMRIGAGAGDRLLARDNSETLLN